MASGDGWLNTDGRIVSNGTYTSHEALGTVPEMAAAFARIQEVDDAIVRRVRAIHKTARASHIASGEPMEDFHFDANLHDDHEPQAATDKAIDDGGWAGIALRLVDGVREVILTRYGASSGPFTQALASLEEGLGFTTPSQPVHGQALPGDLTDSSQGCDPVFGPR